MSYVVAIGPDIPPDVATLGGKGAGLAFLSAAGVRTPAAVVVTAEGYRAALGPALRHEVADRLARIPPDADQIQLDQSTADVRRLIASGSEGHSLTDEIHAAFHALRRQTGDPELCVAVRSSSTAEDAADRSFAGGHDTYLWVNSADDVARRVRDCWASLATARAVAYRAGLADQRGDPAMAVVIQQMVPARASGVLMTLNPINGDLSKVMIESVWGFGEPLVSGEVTPDRFLLDKITGELLRSEIADKPTRATRGPPGRPGLVRREVAPSARLAASLGPDALAEPVRLGRIVERQAGAPQDVEFAVSAEGAAQDVVLLQCRPETAWTRRQRRSAAAPGMTAMDAILATLTHSGPRATGWPL